MSQAVYPWHPNVVSDFREFSPDLREAYLEQVKAIKADPNIGEHLDRRSTSGDLSTYRKVKFGHDTARGPSHRIVYQLLPDSSTPSRFRVIAGRSRVDVYRIAVQRLESEG